MPRANDGTRWQGKQDVVNGGDDGVRIGEPSSGGAGAAVEEGVASEHRAELGCVEATGARGVTWCVQDPYLGSGYCNELVVLEMAIGLVPWMRLLPNGQVIRVQQDWGVGGVREFGCCPDMVVVGVGGEDRRYSASVDEIKDRLDIVGYVDDDAFGVVADYPSVVVDVNGVAVERERS